MMPMADARVEIINQLAAPLAQSAGVARQQTTDKSQQIRRAQALRKDVAAGSDTFEHQVESCEEDTPIHDERRKQQSKRDGRGAKNKSAQSNPQTSGDDEQPHVDVTV
jgi:hypothetical protein